MTAPALDMVLSASQRARDGVSRADDSLRSASEGSFENVLSTLRGSEQTNNQRSRSDELRERAQADKESRSKRTEEESSAAGMADSAWLADQRTSMRTRLRERANQNRLGGKSDSIAQELMRDPRRALTLGAKTAKAASDSTKRGAAVSQNDVSKAFQSVDKHNADQQATKRKAFTQEELARTTRNRRSMSADAIATGKAAKAQMMRKQLHRQVTEYTARSVKQMQATSSMIRPDAVPTPAKMTTVSVVKPEPKVIEEQDQSSPTSKVSNLLSDVASIQAETIEGTGATLKATAVQTPEAPAPVAERIIQHIERVMAQSQRQMTVSMGDLGDVRISIQRLAMNQGGLQVVLEATDARASQLLQSSIGQLSEALQQRGYGDAVVDVHETDSESTAYSDDQAHEQTDDANEEQEQLEAELAARKRSKDSARSAERKGVER